MQNLNQQFPSHSPYSANTVSNQPVDLLSSSIDQLNLQGRPGSNILSPEIAGSKPSVPVKQKLLLQSYSQEYINKLRSETMQFGQKMQSLAYRAEHSSDGFTNEFQVIIIGYTTSSYYSFFIEICVFRPTIYF